MLSQRSIIEEENLFETSGRRCRTNLFPSGSWFLAKWNRGGLPVAVVRLTHFVQEGPEQRKDGDMVGLCNEDENNNEKPGRPHYFFHAGIGDFTSQLRACFVSKEEDVESSVVSEDVDSWNCPHGDSIDGIISEMTTMRTRRMIARWRGYFQPVANSQSCRYQSQTFECRYVPVDSACSTSAAKPSPPLTSSGLSSSKPSQ